MAYLRFALVAVNALAFLVLGVMSLKRRWRESSVWVRRLWAIIALGCGAVLVGSLQRLVIQAAGVGWLSDSVADSFTTDVQLMQSLVVLALIVAAFITLGRLSGALDASGRLTDSLLDRVRHIDPANLRLTSRESEVLRLIGEGVTTDAGLSEELHVSPSTIQSHVKSLLRKTRLNRRTDLVAVAVLVTSSENRPSR